MERLQYLVNRFLIGIVFTDVVLCLQNIDIADVKKDTSENSELKMPTFNLPSALNIPSVVYWKTPTLPSSSPSYPNQNLQTIDQAPPIYSFQKQVQPGQAPNISPSPQASPAYVSISNPDLLSLYLSNLLHQQQNQPIPPQQTVQNWPQLQQPIQLQPTVENWPQLQQQNQPMFQYQQTFAQWPQQQQQAQQWVQPHQWVQPQQDLFKSQNYIQQSQQVPQQQLTNIGNGMPYDQTLQNGFEPNVCQQLVVKNQQLQQLIDYYKLLVATLQAQSLHPRNDKKNHENQEPIQLVSKIGQKPQSIFGPQKIVKDEDKVNFGIERPNPKPPLVQQFISDQAKKEAVKEEQHQQAISGID